MDIAEIKNTYLKICEEINYTNGFFVPNKVELNNQII